MNVERGGGARIEGKFECVEGNAMGCGSCCAGEEIPKGVATGVEALE